MSDKFIVTNFAYGTGPYLRTTELAIAFNNELERLGKSKLGVIVPWVYGEKQKRIMREEFGDVPEIILDDKLGAVLKKVFYSDESFEKYLEQWVKNASAVSAEARNDLLKTYGDKIVVELNRSPRISYNIAPSYFTSFGYLSEIFQKAASENKITLNKNLLGTAVEVADKIEKNQKIHCIAYPATPAYLENRPPRYSSEIEVPPITSFPKINMDSIEKGIYITVSGISGLEKLYEQAGKLSIKIYSNNPNVVPNSEKALPEIITNKNIIFQFARSGWGSVWLSLFAGTPLVVPEYDSADDPEIYFNNLTIEKLGIGIIYRGQSLDELLKQAKEVKNNMAKIRQKIFDRWGTLDGNQYCAKLFVEDCIKSRYL
ncbi:MAG: hypothetical protein AAB454_02300 [Patescibacteria group bacterium]